MSEKQYSIDELCEKFNSLNENNNIKYDDGRLKEHLTIRRIRDFLSKGILSKGIKNGRNVYYTDSHLNELIEIRNKQILGISDSTLIKSQSKSHNIGDLIKNIETSMKDNYINDIQKNKNIVLSNSNFNFLRNTKYKVSNKKTYTVEINEHDFIDITLNISKKLNDYELSNILTTIKKIIEENKWKKK